MTVQFYYSFTDDSVLEEQFRDEQFPAAGKCRQFETKLQKRQAIISFREFRIDAPLVPTSPNRLECTNECIYYDERES